MLTRDNYLLMLIMEECAEVAQRASKAIRFGIREKQPGQELDNVARLRNEILDLIVTIELLEGQICAGLLPPVYNGNLLKDERRQKIEKYMDYSRNLGLVE